MVNCISYENYLKEKMKKCFLTAHPTADIFLVLEPRGRASFQDKWGLKRQPEGLGRNDCSQGVCSLLKV